MLTLSELDPRTFGKRLHATSGAALFPLAWFIELCFSSQTPLVDEGQDWCVLNRTHFQIHPDLQLVLPLAG